MQRGKRPTVMLMQDDYFGHRHPVTGEPCGEKDEWIDWDFRLDKAFQIIEAYTDQDGIRQWQNEDPYQRIGAQRKINAFHEARDQITNAKNYKAQPGEYFVPVLETAREDNTFWTYQEWREHEIAEMLKDGKIE